MPIRLPHSTPAWIFVISTERPKLARHTWTWHAIPSWPLYPLGLIPAVWLFWRGVEGHLGADPVGTFEKMLGLWAIRFLAASLVISPIRWLTGISLLKYRRALGLLAFIYVVLHVTAYVWLDIGFNGAILIRDITRRPFIILGALAFLALIPLALTSNRLSIRKLGRRWSRLHRLVYLVALLAGIHLFLAFKRPTPTSELYDGLLAALLLARVVHGAFSGRRHAGRSG
jgi:methionine sulfoxide reductase heme-binding subunit